MKQTILSYIFAVLYFPIYAVSYLLYLLARLLLCIAYLGLLLPNVSWDIFASIFTNDFLLLYNKDKKDDKNAN